MENIEPRVRRDERSNLERRRDTLSKLSLWHVIGGAALIGLAAVVIATLPDVKRYIKISSM